MSLYSKINDIDISKIVLNNDLVKISTWAYRWEILFNPHINKQATEIYFSQRPVKSLAAPIIFNNNNLLTSPKLSFNDILINK